MSLFLPFMVFALASWALPVEFAVKKITIDGQVITRTTPIIDNITTEGVDSIDNGYSSLRFYTDFPKPKATFKLSAAQCIEIAIKSHEKSTLKNPYIEKIEGLYEPVWLFHLDELRPAFKVRLPVVSIYDLKDIYVDAESGKILKSENPAMFLTAPAEVFTYSPPFSNPSRIGLKAVTLKNLSSLKENGFLEGDFFSVRTCCKFFTCPKEGECNEETKRCALKTHENAMQFREILDLPTDTLGLDPLVALPPTISVNAVRCTNLPFARAGYKADGHTLGFFATPIDDSGPEAEMDKFSEIQVYHSMMTFFEHIRFLLNDPTWCLRKEAMSCNPDGTPVLNSEGKPANPYKVFVNQLIPDMKIEGPHKDDPDNFLRQIFEGKGSKENPITLDSFARTGNAAFVPALSTLKKNAPRADEILSDLIKPYDHNVFFQGDRDFAYDGDVVFHEFMHAITTSLVGKLNSLGLDQWGINTEPGSLNEAWADYFAAAFTNDPNVGEYASIKGGYGETSLRKIENEASCPKDTIGEIHNDGLIWSGALWEIRSLVDKTFGQDKAIEFDKAVLASLAQAATDESFKAQGQKLLSTIKSRGLGAEIATIAEKVFNKRGISDCFRVSTLSTVDENNRLTLAVKSMLFVPSKNQIGLENYAPMTSQLEVAIPAGATSLTISWRQYLGTAGALLGTEVSPMTTQNSLPLSALATFDTPITWRFKKTSALPTKDGQKIVETPINAVFKDGYWQLSIPLDLKRCEQKTMYISLLSNDFKYALENLNVSFETDHQDRSDCRFYALSRTKGENLPVGCSTALPWESVFFLAILWMRKGKSGSHFISHSISR